MSRGLADTSVFIARETGWPMDVGALPEELGVSVVTLAELRAGVLAVRDVATRDRRLETLTSVLSLEPLPIDGHVAERWAQLCVVLRDRRLRMPPHACNKSRWYVTIGAPRLNTVNIGVMRGTLKF